MSGRLRRALRRYRSGQWWDWAHPAMILVGRDDEDGIPRPRDLYVRRDAGRLVSTYDWAAVRAHLATGAENDWIVFDSQNDGFELHVRWLTGGAASLDGLDSRRLLIRWLLVTWARDEWFGLRRWIYYRALRSAVHARVPFTCQQTPSHDSGGYDHWHCQVRGRHETHRFRAYTWTDAEPVRWDGGAR